MQGFWLLLALLICPLTMGLMMFFMMRGRRGDRERRHDSEEEDEP